MRRVEDRTALHWYCVRFRPAFVGLMCIAVTSGCQGTGGDDGNDERGSEQAVRTGEPGTGQTASDRQPPFLTPPGLVFPYMVENACPGEGCTYGEWLACAPVPIRQQPRTGAAVVSQLQAQQPFEVLTGTVVVDVPEVVVVTRPTRQFGFADEGVTFAPGDTVYVLDYLGEGYFNVWYAGAKLESEVFWPWADFIPGADWEYGGEVVQAGQHAFWLNVSSDEGEGWVEVDWSAMTAPSLIDPAPLACS